jgi:hypothetical protein
MLTATSRPVFEVVGSGRLVQPLGAETISRVRPHDTVFVEGGGGMVQHVPWNVPGFGDSDVLGTTSVFGAFGLTADDKQKLAERIRAATFTSDVQAILEVITNPAERQEVAALAVSIGADPGRVQQALASIERGAGFKVLTKPLPMPLRITWSVLSTASFAACVYHGYKRNDSIGWALWWGFMGALFPVAPVVIAVAQGFGKPKRSGFGSARLRAARGRGRTVRGRSYSRR